MKTVTVRDLQKQLRECIEASQEDRVVVTRHGRPAAVLVGIEGKDWESVILQTSAEFWKLIEKRRREKTVSLAEMPERVGAAAEKARSSVIEISVGAVSPHGRRYGPSR